MDANQVLDRMDTSSPSVALVARVYDAFDRKDVPALLGLLDPSCTVRQSSRLPWGGEYDGHGGVLDFLGRLTSTVQSVAQTERYLDDQDGHVVASGFTRGTVVASGRPFEVAETHVWTVRDGKILRFEAYIDTATMRDALGLHD